MTINTDGLSERDFEKLATMLAAARAMLAALHTMRLQLYVALADKEALSIEKQLLIVDAAIIQAEQAGITTGEVK